VAAGPARRGLSRGRAPGDQRLPGHAPGVSTCQVEGNYYAWKPEPGDEFAGEQLTGEDEDELRAKLAAAPGG